MPQQSAGHLIVESLKAHGVDRVFTVGGAQAVAALAYGLSLIHI